MSSHDLGNCILRPIGNNLNTEDSAKCVRSREECCNDYWSLSRVSINTEIYPSHVSDDLIRESSLGYRIAVNLML